MEEEEGEEGKEEEEKERRTHLSVRVIRERRTS